MKILQTVEFYYPSKGGAQEVVRQLSERLVKLGHDVTVATTRLPDRSTETLNGVKIKSFDISGNIVRGYQGNTRGYTDFVLNSDFDVILNYAAQQWATDLCLPLLGKIKAKKVLVPCGFSGLFVPAYQEYFNQMPSWMKQYDASVFLSNEYRDIAFARKNGIPNLHIIPNGCGFDEFESKSTVDIRHTLGIDPTDFLVLHVGTHTGLKGHNELFQIMKRSKVRRATLLIVGNAMTGGCTRTCTRRSWFFNHSLHAYWHGVRALVADLTREETLAAYHAADLFLFPSNIECSPLVLFEAMASKTPFLTTDVGNSKEIIEWSHGGRLLPTQKDSEGGSHAEIEPSARMLNALWKSSEDRACLATSGYEAWSKRFTWEAITKQYEDLFKSLTGK